MCFETTRQWWKVVQDLILNFTNATALSFHRVREAIAAKIIGFYHISGEINTADLSSFGLCYNLCCFGRMITIDEMNYSQEKA